MLLSADIGNSSIKFGVFDIDNKNLVPMCTFKISSVTDRSADEYEVIIKSILHSKYKNYAIDCSVISSVVPSLTHIIKGALHSITNCTPFIIGYGTKTGFKIKTDNPSEFGADMVCNAAYALSCSEAPIIIVDMGTATTITYINENKEIEGSVIIPGAGVSLKALTDSAELLGNMAFSKPNNLIGKNTADSIMSGVIYGNLFTIDSFINEIRKKVEFNDNIATLVATGGLAPYFIPYCNNKFELSENMTLVGAAILYFKNKKNIN